MGRISLDIAGHEWSGAARHHPPLLVARLRDSERRGRYRDYAVLAVCGPDGQVTLRGGDAFVSGIRDESRPGASDAPACFSGVVSAADTVLFADAVRDALAGSAGLLELLGRADGAASDRTAIAQLKLGRFEDAAATAEILADRRWTPAGENAGRNLVEQLTGLASQVAHAVTSHPVDNRVVRPVADEFKRVARYFDDGRRLAEFADFLQRGRG